MSTVQPPRVGAGHQLSDRRLANVYRQSEYYRLFDESERVRWRMGDIQWDRIDTSRVSAEWRTLVRMNIDAELTTFEATERFFKDFAQDSDFTQWLSIWLYEETKHPSALIRYLAAFGERLTSQDVLKGRETHPFVSSRMATLCMNINSEILASTGYVHLSRHTPEPVLGDIFRKLGADEARHASHFFTYAKRMLTDAESPKEQNRMRRDAVATVKFWIDTDRKVMHPVNMHLTKLQDASSTIANEIFVAIRELSRARQIAMCGRLVGQSLTNLEDVNACLQRLWWA